MDDSKSVLHTGHLRAEVAEQSLHRLPRAKLERSCGDCSTSDGISGKRVIASRQNPGRTPRSPIALPGSCYRQHHYHPESITAMATTLLGALALASVPSALAFRNTSPFFLFSTAKYVS